MGWKLLKVYNHNNLKECVKLAKQRMDFLKDKNEGALDKEGIGVAYAGGKLVVGYSLEETENRIDFYSLSDIETIMAKINSKSVAKTEEVLYKIILTHNYPKDLTVEAHLEEYMEHLGVRKKTLTYQAEYSEQAGGFVFGLYSPEEDERIPLAKIGYDKQSKELHIVEKGNIAHRVEPTSRVDTLTEVGQEFNQQLRNLIETHQQKAVSYFVKSVDKPGMDVQYNERDRTVVVVDEETGKVRLKGKITYGKGYGTQYEYRFNYQEYYKDGEPHPYPKSYRVTVKNRETFQAAVETFSQNL